ncbi:MAG: hypothetical protein GY822_04745 [Deltaproteobacteria bacterium]|nr:hypothetical protein [Deltaproteobacteria bacterium]
MDITTRRIASPLFALRWMRLMLFTGVVACAVWVSWPVSACDFDGCKVPEKIHQSIKATPDFFTSQREDQQKAWRARMLKPSVDVPSLLDLNADSVTFSVSSSGCFHHDVTRLYITGNTVVIEQEETTFDEVKEQVFSSWKPLGTLKLSTEDLAGIDLWLLEMATAGVGGCTSSTRVEVKVEGIEKTWTFDDDTCGSSGAAHMLSPWQLKLRLEKLPTED